jgi:hypothetical protein
MRMKRDPHAAQIVTNAVTASVEQRQGYTRRWPSNLNGITASGATELA